MHTFTHTTMNKLSPIVFAVIGTFFVLALAGCEGGREEPYVPPTQEVVSPTGCLKSKGRYYDPKIKDCVQVTDKHQALVLNTYRYVNKLVEEGKVSEADFYIFLKTYITLEKAESLWAELRAKGAKMSVLSGILPEARKYDPESGFQTTKVWGGPGVSIGCGWHSSFNPPPAEDTVQSMALAGVVSREQDTFLGPAHAMPQLRKAIFDDNDCRVYSFSLKADPEVILSFWNNHLDDIEAIQPLINDLDRIQPVLGPVQSLKEGE